jgi:hypothetical protein
MKSYKSLNILQAHFQSRTSQRSNQSFVKELAKPTQEKLFLKNFPTLQKIKNATHSRQKMTRKLNTDNGLQGRTDRTPAYPPNQPHIAQVTFSLELRAKTRWLERDIVLRVGFCC